MKDAFPSDKKKNPKDCMAIQLRSGKDLKEKTEKNESNKEDEGLEIAETLEGKRKKEQLSKKKARRRLRTICLRSHFHRGCRNQG